MYPLNSNFKLFSLKDMMFLSHWYCMQDIDIVELFTNFHSCVYHVLIWNDSMSSKNILNLSINSSFNWSTLTSVQTSTMAAHEKRLKQGSLYGFKFIKTRDWMKTMKQATRIYTFILI
jgi:hypothetical protein